MSLWGMSWFEAIAVTLGILGWQVLICLLAERILARRPNDKLDATKPDKGTPAGDEHKRAA
ncbi:MAG: hypothetical protein K0S86_1288 [Geminicoccaceae bacterium]|jgi:hypothetical protein|nr:hypothetical protein [Geminicoccaceae bacterium]